LVKPYKTIPLAYPDKDFHLARNDKLRLPHQDLTLYFCFIFPLRGFGRQTGYAYNDRKAAYR
jgi:hypothetical protein